jgi:hypothetical protein
MFSSGTYWCIRAFSRRALARSEPNGFSTMTPVPGRTPGRGNALSDPAEQRRRYLQVVQHPLAAADLPGHGLVGALVAEVAIDVPQQPQHLRSRRAVRVHVVELRRRGGVVAELPQVPAAFGHPDDRHVEHTALHQADQGREGLEFRQAPVAPKITSASTPPAAMASPPAAMSLPILARWAPRGAARPVGSRPRGVPPQ